MVTILLTLIFLRPFISSLAFPETNVAYCLILFSLLAIWVLTKGLKIKRLLPLKISLSLFCLAVAVSLLVAKNITASANELYKYVSAILLFIIASSFNEKEKINTIKTIVVAGLVISLLAIYQYCLGFHNITGYLTRQKISDPFTWDIIGRRRVFLPFVTPNTLAGYLVMVMPLALTIKKKIWFLFPMAVALILTKSLGGFFSLLIALSLYFYLKGGIDRKKIAVFTATVIIAAILFFIRSNTATVHTHPLFSSLMRWHYWKETLLLIRQSPVLGVGLGNFNLYFSRYAHNSYLQIWAEMGILGLFGFLGIVFASLAECVKKLKPLTNNCNSIKIGLLTSAAAFLIHNLIDFSFFLPEVSLVWWVILGLLL